MTKIELLEKQIADLDYDSFAKLREWFIEFDQTIWDKKLESDSNFGKLDLLRIILKVYSKLKNAESIS